MPINPTAVLCFFTCDERSEENDRHALQRPIRLELRRDLGSVRLRHDKIDKHEVRLEIARCFQCAARIDHRARDIFFALIEKQSRAAHELGIVVDD